MTLPGALFRGAAACGLAAALCCASSGSSTATRPCAGFSPPALLSAGPVVLPQTYVSVRLAAEVVDEIVVGRDGAVDGVKVVATAIPLLAPFAEASLRKAKFTPGTIEGNPVAVRGWIRVPIGSLMKGVRGEPAYDSLRAFIPGGASSEARWQLAGSVERLVLVAHIGNAVPRAALIVAVAPGGAEQTLLTLAAAMPPLEIRETVKTGRFFRAAGDYRLELRAAGEPIASTTVTIASGFESAIVNACEPLVGPEKTGPGH